MELSEELEVRSSPYKPGRRRSSKDHRPIKFVRFQVPCETCISCEELTKRTRKSLRRRSKMYLNCAEYSTPYENAPRSILLNSTKNQPHERKSIRVSKYRTDGDVTRMKVKYKKKKRPQRDLLTLTNQALEEGLKAERSAIENTQRARQGRERQEEIYEQFVRAEGMSKELNRGMLYSLLRPLKKLVCCFPSKSAEKYKESEKERLRRERIERVEKSYQKRYSTMEPPRKSVQLRKARAGVANMRSMAVTINSETKKQNAEIDASSKLASKNQKRISRVNRNLKENLDGQHDGWGF